MMTERSNERQFSFLLHQVLSARTSMSHSFLSLRAFLCPTVPMFVQVFLLLVVLSGPASPPLLFLVYMYTCQK